MNSEFEKQFMKRKEEEEKKSEKVFVFSRFFKNKRNFCNFVIISFSLKYIFLLCSSLRDDSSCFGDMFMSTVQFVMVVLSTKFFSFFCDPRGCLSQIL